MRLSKSTFCSALSIDCITVQARRVEINRILPATTIDFECQDIPLKSPSDMTSQTEPINHRGFVGLSLLDGYGHSKVYKAQKGFDFIASDSGVKTFAAVIRFQS